jgi:Protein of unknown function (DUF4232)
VSRTRLAVLIGLVAIIGLVCGLVVAATNGAKPRRGIQPGSSRAALHPVLTAVAVTTGSESYAFDYSTSFQPGDDPSSPGPPPSMTSGHGVVNLNPYVMLTTNSPESSYANVTAVFDASAVWEFGAGDYGTGSRGQSEPGNSLSVFAPLVEGSLGQGQGALVMVGVANPTGRLTLDQTMVTKAQQVGTGTVDGAAVTNYKVSINLSKVLDQPGLSDQQQATISQALTILSQSGYLGTTDVVSIDAAGYIRATRSVASFSNGGSVTTDNTLSDIGCAGTVTPGQPVVTPAPPGCVSPDQPGTKSATSTPSAVPVTPPIVPMCSPSQIEVAVAFNQSGNDLGAIKLANTGSQPCSLLGQPTVSVLDGNGTPLVLTESTYARAGLPPPPSSPVVLSPSTTSPGAIVELDWLWCGAPLGSMSLEIQFSGWPSPLTVPNAAISPPGFAPEQSTCSQSLFAVDVVRAFGADGIVDPSS